MNKKGWAIVQAVALALMLAAELLAVVLLIQLDMVPLMYMALLGTALFALWAVTGLLMFVGYRNPQKTGIVRRIVALILAVAVIAGCGVAGNAAVKIKKMISSVTDPGKVSAIISVYVLAEDAAQNLQDAQDYVFAAMTSFDTEGTQKATQEMEASLGEEITLRYFDSAPAMVNALYNQEVDALILNSAYVTVLEDIDIYADFTVRTKVLHEVILYEEPKPTDSTVPSGETAPQPSTEPEKEIHVEPFVIYISGSDTRNQLLTVSRSDVNILVVVNPVTKQILMVNTQRDAYVPNPAGGGALDKLTHCGIYGIDCSIQALSDLYGQQIDHFVQINFAGFSTLVDAIGGITVYSDVAFSTSNGNCEIKVGYNDLNGEQALAFARERHALKGGDRDRGKNQMKVITAIIEKLSSGTIITKYAQILDGLEGMILTDLSSDQISDLVKMQLSQMPRWEIFSYATTGKGGSAETYSMPGRNLYVWWPDESSVQKAAQLMDKVLSGELLTEQDLEN